MNGLVEVCVSESQASLPACSFPSHATQDAQKAPQKTPQKEVREYKLVGASVDEAEVHRRLCALWLEDFMFDLKVITHKPLAEASKQGDYPLSIASSRSIFEKELYAYAWRRLLRYATSPARGYTLGQRAEDWVSEACQEGTLRFINRLKKRWPDVEFPSFMHARSYFFVITRNCLVDLIRKKQREQQRREQPKQQALIDEMKKLWPDVDSWEWESMQVAVERWIALRCKPIDRTLLIERFFSYPPRSYREIAEEMNESNNNTPNKRYSAGQLRVRKHRLVRDLVKWLKEELEHA